MSDSKCVALVGCPNCGKTALFNSFTGSNQKVANYPGVTVEQKQGFLKTPAGQQVRLIDLPGTYSLEGQSVDEKLTQEVLTGQQGDHVDAVVAVCDATQLKRNLAFILELVGLGKPLVLALNMVDLADKREQKLNVQRLSQALGIPVIPTIAVKNKGISEISSQLDLILAKPQNENTSPLAQSAAPVDIRQRFQQVDALLDQVIEQKPKPSLWTTRFDRFLLHPVGGTVFLAALLLFLFQALFNWAAYPADLLDAGVVQLGSIVTNFLPDNALRSLLVDGIIAGVGAVVVFLPQILFLFLFILLLEGSGYMARAAFLMDRLMAKVGLNGRAFIPLLSSYACAIPGIMAARTIANRWDRLTTIMIAPLTTCSARLPVYTLLIAAFIPNEVVWGPFKLQGLVMFSLYAIGVLAVLAVAFVLRRTLLKGPKPTLIMDMPTYKWPSLRNVVFGLWQRALIFIKRVGGLILAVSMALWFLASYPKAPVDYPDSPITYSYAGRIGKTIEPVLSPVGFNWEISLALIPGLAAREVMVGALGTVYALEDGDEAGLADHLASRWSLATALSLLAWYIFAPQCLATLMVARRETNSWRWPVLMFSYMMVLAYSAAFITYHLAS